MNGEIRAATRTLQSWNIFSSIPVKKALKKTKF